MPPRRHPLNQDHTWSPPAPPYRRITEEQARRYREEGYFVLEDAIDGATLERLIAEIDPHEAKVEAYLRAQAGGRRFIARAGEISFTTHLVLKSPYLRAFCAGQPLRDLCSDLLGPDVRLYWDQAVYKKPGTESPFPWHQDNGYNFVEPQSYLTCWIALTDATEENGCPWVVPGLHRLGTLEHWTTDLGYQCLEDPPAAVAAPARAGSIVVFTSLTPHATGPNRSASVRKAYIVQYAVAGTARVVLDDATGERRLIPQNERDRQFTVLSGGEAPLD